MKALLAQTAMELRLTARRGENVLVTLAIPLGLLLFFSSVDLFSVGGSRPVDYLLPGILAVAIMSTSLVSLGIATAYERHYGVLKRLGSTPLTRPRLIGAKILAVLLIEALQVILLAGSAALWLGWRPAGNVGAGILDCLIGTAAFAGLGLLMAGALRAEATLAGANALYLSLLLISGIFLPITHLPGPLQAIAPGLPATALAALLRASLAGLPFAPRDLFVLLAWAIGAIGLTARTFRWE